MSDTVKYDPESHFRFGENWRKFAESIGEAQIKHSEEGLLNLVDRENLQGKTFLDIGCGSGLHTLAALRLGVKHATAVDFDPQSVATTRSLLKCHWQEDNVDVKEGNILAGLQLGAHATFGIVYSWGALHHTGDMWEAIRKTSHLVSADGKLIIAIYKKTPLCGVWRIEKRLYRKLPKLFSALVLYPFALLFIVALLIQGRSPKKFLDEYSERRGARWIIDLHDWLGGYPYDSASRKQIEEFLTAESFILEKVRGGHPPPLWGLFGSGCAEYVFRRAA